MYEGEIYLIVLVVCYYNGWCVCKGVVLMFFVDCVDDGCVLVFV